MADFGVKITPVLDVSGAGTNDFKRQLSKFLEEQEAKIQIKTQLDVNSEELRGQIGRLLDGINYQYVTVGAFLSSYSEQSIKEELNDMLRRVEENANHIKIFGDTEGITGIAEAFSKTGEYIHTTVDMLGDFGSTLSRAIDEFAGLEGAARGIDQVNARLSEMADLITQINNKEFNIQNIIQPGGDTQAVSQLRVYREEAQELAKYVNKLYTSFLDVGRISSEIYRVKDFREALNDLQTINMDSLFDKIGNTESIGKIDAIRSQLMTYKGALEQIIEITRSGGIDIELPDSSGIQRATENVKAFDEQAKLATEALTKEAAAAQGAATSIGEVNAKAAELKIDTPAAGESFDLIKNKIDEILALLPQIQVAIQSAFDVSAAIANVQSLTGQYEQLRQTIGSLSELTAQSLSVSGAQNVAPLESAQMATIRAQLEQIDGLADTISQKIATAFNFEGSVESIQSMRQSFDDFVQNLTSLSDYVRIISEQVGEVTVPAEASNALDNILQKLNGISIALQDIKSAQDATFDFSGALAKVSELAQSYAVLTENVRAWSSMQNKVEGAATGGGNVATQVTNLQRLENSLSRISSFKGIKFLNDEQSMERWNAELEVTRKLLEEIKTATGDEKTAAVNAFNAQLTSLQRLKEALNEVQTQTNKLGNLRVDVDSLTSMRGIKFAGDAESMERYNAQIEKVEQAINSLRTAKTEQYNDAVAGVQREIKALENLKKSLNDAAAGVSNLGSAQRSAASLADKIDIWKQKNPKAYKDAKDQVDNWLSTLRTQGPIAAESIRNIESEFKHISHQEKIAGNNGQTFFQQMKAGWSKFGGWSLVSRSFMSVIRTFKQAVTAVKEVDAAMTELRKVTDETETGYRKFFESATQMASQVGAKLSDTIMATSDFARLGFTLADSAKLAETSLLYKNIGDGIQDISEATESLISTMKAFQINAADSISIVDMFNEVNVTCLHI